MTIIIDKTLLRGSISRPFIFINCSFLSRSNHHFENIMNSYFIVFLVLIVLIMPIDGVYQSYMVMSSNGLEFQPRSSIQLLLTKTFSMFTPCAAACNQLVLCRTFDYDSTSKQCRLFEGDSSTGSIVSSSSSTSFVGTVRISADLYSSIHNFPCQACEQNRYEVCSTNTSTCQCPAHTYWDGYICALQLFTNDTCENSISCRTDLNLSCTFDCSGQSSRCAPSASISK